MKNVLLTILSLSFIICCILPQVRMDKKPDGIFTDYYENGQKKEETLYKDGKKNGSGIRWYPNGQIAQKGNFLNDMQDGFLEA